MSHSRAELMIIIESHSHLESNPMSSQVALLEVDKVSYGYGHHASRRGGGLVVDDLSFRLHAGEIACLLGSSGCGKTTALRLIAG